MQHKFMLHFFLVYNYLIYIFAIIKKINEMENNNLDIFISTHTNFEVGVKNDSYKIMSCKNIEFDTNLNVLYDNIEYNKKHNVVDSIIEWDHFYSELTTMYWVWKNYEIKDYIGLCQYRRYFGFFDDVPNMDEIFECFDVILPIPYTFNCTVKQQYELFHNIKDINMIIQIISEDYPEYNEDCESVLSNNIFYTSNMFIMKKNDFIKCCEFIFGVINSYLERNNLLSLKDIEIKVSNEWHGYGKPFYPNNTLWYQSRIGGFLAERLLNIFIRHNFKNIKHYPINITENKY